MEKKENTQEMQTEKKKSYLETSVFKLTADRIGWLLILMVSGMISGGILSSFEDAIVLIPALVSFVPMLTDTGGNAGSQSSSIVIQELAYGNIEPKDFLKVIWKEFRVSLICGFILSLVNFFRILIIKGSESIKLALTVSIAMMVTVVLAKITGAMLSIGAKALKFNPALVSAPILTTIIDAGALIVFFNVAKLILKF